MTAARWAFETLACGTSVFGRSSRVRRVRLPQHGTDIEPSSLHLVAVGATRRRSVGAVRLGDGHSNHRRLDAPYLPIRAGVWRPAARVGASHRAAIITRSATAGPTRTARHATCENAGAETPREGSPGRRVPGTFVRRHVAWSPRSTRELPTGIRRERLTPWYRRYRRTNTAMNPTAVTGIAYNVHGRTGEPINASSQPGPVRARLQAGAKPSLH